MVQGTGIKPVPFSLLYPYQQEAVSFLERIGGNAGLFLEMGTGKTRVALAYLSRQPIKRIMVVGPISSSAAWRKEVVKLGLGLVVYDLTVGTIAERVALAKVIRNDQRPLLFIVNYETYWQAPRKVKGKKRAGLRNILLTLEPEAIVLDEAHRIKGRGTRQSRHAQVISRRFFVKHRLALTGTPIANGLEDLFALYRFIDPKIFGTDFAAFQSEYIEYGGYLGMEITGYRNEDKARQLLEQTSFQIGQSEALHLPEPKDMIIPVTLGAKARKQYNELKKESLAKVEGTGLDGQPIKGLALARIVLTSLLRLQQMTGGFVNTEDKGIIDISDEKLRMTIDLIEDATAGGRRVVVFARFKHDLNRLKARIPGAVVIRGGQSQAKREAAIDDLNAGRANVALVQIKAGSESIDLTGASVAIFYSPSFSLLEKSQARSRLYRHGQKRRVLFYHMIVEQSVDEKIYKALQTKRFNAGKITSLDYARELFTD